MSTYFPDHFCRFLFCGDDDGADCVCVRSLLLGDPTKAEKLLGWKRKVDLDSLVEEMVPTNLQASRNRGPIENRNRVLSVAYGEA